MFRRRSRTLLKTEGLDLAVMPCCVVNQSSLAIDARDPVQLVGTIERLIGTWPMRAQLQELDQAVAEQIALEGSSEMRVAELAALRLKLRPEVSKLLECKQQRTALESEQANTLALFADRVSAVKGALGAEVSIPNTVPKWADIGPSCARKQRYKQHQGELRSDLCECAAVRRGMQGPRNCRPGRTRRSNSAQRRKRAARRREQGRPRSASGSCPVLSKRVRRRRQRCTGRRQW